MPLFNFDWLYCFYLKLAYTIYPSKIYPVGIKTIHRPDIGNNILKGYKSKW